MAVTLEYCFAAEEIYHPSCEEYNLQDQSSQSGTCNLQDQSGTFDSPNYGAPGVLLSSDLFLTCDEPSIDDSNLASV
ncbi:unnamed protein product [Larinioides sclopetarius]|uniref:Uncharacterized protein n=1 Tax=Larinioides sclopetarius TaxID=280406 RepID=A0AAV2ATL1_9ARAC